MESFEETRRQIRLALMIFLTLVPVSVIAFMVIEGLSLLDSVWLTIITLATIGYGDIYAKTDLGRVFTIGLIVVGLAAFAFAAQAILGFFLSPEISFIRQRRRIERAIHRLKGHYIIAGEGELVDKTVRHLLERAASRAHYERARYLVAVERILGSKSKFTPPVAYALASVAMNLRTFIKRRSGTLLDAIVVITDDAAYAARLRRMGLLVVRGDSTEDGTLLRAGVDHARAMMIMESTDTDSLLTVLSARNQNTALYITAAVLDDAFAPKMLRVGANVVIQPFDLAGQFLNNATLRPAVHDFFNSLVFERDDEHSEVVQLYLHDNSPWIGQMLGMLRLRERFSAAVIGVRRSDGSFAYAPSAAHLLCEDEVLLAVCPADQIPALRNLVEQGAQAGHTMSNWQRLALQAPMPALDRTYTLDEAQRAVESLSSHYIICGGGRVAQNAINELDPTRAFVVILSDIDEAHDLLARGFRVIVGSPTNEKVLKQAGIGRALACMIAIDDRATNVLSVLTCRTLSRSLLIVATAESDEMIPKLYQAGADRVVSPFDIAARFVLMATMRPVVSEFVIYVLFNRQTGLETTELYMDEGLPWVGQTLAELDLTARYDAGVIGIRTTDGRFVYSPDARQRISAGEVLIVVTPMRYSDQLRTEAYGASDRRPKSLRQARTLPSLSY